MKKLILIAVGVAAFSCGDNNTRNAGNGNTQSEGTIENKVEAENNMKEGSGEAISPQLEQDSINKERYDVDTVSSSTGIHERQKRKH